MNDAIGTIGLLIFFLMLFAFIVVMRYLNYRETMTLAEKGLVRYPERSKGGKGLLIWGVLITALGLALTLGLWLSSPWFTVGRFEDPNAGMALRFGPWVMGGLIPLFIGLGLVLVYVITHNGKTENRFSPPAEQEPVPTDEEKSSSLGDKSTPSSS